jgi:hypothetical protein
MCPIPWCMYRVVASLVCLFASCRQKKHSNFYSLSCREALVLCEDLVFDTLLANAIIDPKKREVNRVLWASLAAYNKELKKPLKNPLDDSERLDKSIVIQDKGVALVDGFTDAVGRELATPPMHHGMGHIPDQVRDIDPKNNYPPEINYQDLCA